MVNSLSSATYKHLNVSHIIISSSAIWFSCILFIFYFLFFLWSNMHDKPHLVPLAASKHHIHASLFVSSLHNIEQEIFFLQQSLGTQSPYLKGRPLVHATRVRLKNMSLHLQLQQHFPPPSPTNNFNELPIDHWMCPTTQLLSIVKKPEAAEYMNMTPSGSTSLF